MNKEIEELQEDLNECIYNAQDDDKLAMDMYSRGYRKQVWHKVKEEDLPELNKLVICLRNESYDNRFIVGRINCDNMWDLQDDDIFFEELDSIIAWTEIPEYKEL